MSFAVGSSGAWMFDRRWAAHDGRYRYMCVCGWVAAAADYLLTLDLKLSVWCVCMGGG